MTDELADLKLQLETLTAAIFIAETTEQSSGDVLAIAHKILSRVDVLRTENERLGKLTSPLYEKTLRNKLELVRRENEEARRHLHLRAALRNTQLSQPH